MYKEIRREIYMRNYTYTNSFFILRTEFRVAPVQTKIFKVSRRLSSWSTSFHLLAYSMEQSPSWEANQ